MSGWSFNPDGSVTFTTNNYGSFTIGDFHRFVSSRSEILAIDPSSAGLENSFTGFLGFQNSYHEYGTTFRPIIPVGAGISPEQVFDVLVNEAATPFTSTAAEHGSITYIPVPIVLGSVLHGVDYDTLTLANLTLDDHGLLPGAVFRSVDVQDGFIGVRTAGVGEGFNIFFFNSVGGNLSFSSLDLNMGLT